ncbi:MAG: histidine kinase [Lachnospiraceae bacterium]|nr:histidine kinase [Lachnospiraceae bacterium]
MRQYLLQMKLKKRLQLLYIICILLPLFLTDAIVLGILVRQENAAAGHERQSTVSSIAYSITRAFEGAASTANQVYLDRQLEEFLTKDYEEPYDYYEAYIGIMKHSYLEKMENFAIQNVTIYVDNDTVINGGRFASLDMERSREWYLAYKDTERDMAPLFLYESAGRTSIEAQRKIMLVKKLNRYHSQEKEMLVKLELDYNRLVRDVQSINANIPVYVCSGDDVILTNQSSKAQGKPFEKFAFADRTGYQETINLYGTELTAYALKGDNFLQKMLQDHGILFALLILLNIGLPYVMVKQIEHSVTGRIAALEAIIQSNETEELSRIDEAQIIGNDEISSLMHSYNRMVDTNEELRQTLYINRMRTQENKIAKQKAELLALYSQINPHFLFNALESIRMHSVIRHEDETADMVGRLAGLQRQYVNWGEDRIRIGEEIEFITSYLELQKYRFGDRINYTIEVEPSCADLIIPKLTVVTFVENACVHGLEAKSGKGWVFIRVYEKDDSVCIEVEDTGCGMSREETEEILKKMYASNLEMLLQGGRVGILNACLRLNLMTEGRTKYSLESEEGIGTIIQIYIPVEKIPEQELHVSTEEVREKSENPV